MQLAVTLMTSITARNMEILFGDLLATIESSVIVVLTSNNC